MIRRYKQMNVEPFPEDQRTMEAARVFFEAEVDRWRRVVLENGIKPVQ